VYAEFVKQGSLVVNLGLCRRNNVERFTEGTELMGAVEVQL